MQYQPGEIINQRYQVTNILGKGGTAVTYEVKDLESEVNVAMKVLSLDRVTDWKIVDLFEREAKALANLHHPRIPNYIDYFYLDLETTRCFYLIQELISGRSLDNLVKKGWHFQENSVREIAQQILSILVYLHNLNPKVIHRDIKPHNIIQADSGEIYLVDFGAVQDVYRNTLTHSGTFVGTIDYMPPEQLRGQANFSSDIYSLGCTLIYLLTKRSPLELSLKNMKLDFRDQVNISHSLANWIDRAIEPVKEDRFSSTEAALDSLCNESFFTGTIFSKPKPANSSLLVVKTNNKLTIQTPQFNKRNWWIYFILLLVIMAIGCPILYIASFSKESIDFIELLIFLVIFGISFSSIIWDCLIVRDYEFLIEIERENFSIFLKFLFFQYKLQGKTKDIHDLQIIYNPNIKGRYHPEYCTFWHGVKQIKFARNTKESEKHWIARQITNFLIQINPQYKIHGSVARKKS